jgi:hypothetical protein
MLRTTAIGTITLVNWNMAKARDYAIDLRRLKSILARRGRGEGGRTGTRNLPDKLVSSSVSRATALHYASDQQTTDYDSEGEQ